MKTAALLLIAGVACAQTFDPTMPAGVPEAAGAVKEYAPLRYIDVKIGAGATAQPGQEYTVHYTGWLRDGAKFDSSVDRNTPFVFVQGRRQVISGWEIGFEGMKVGGKRRLFLPYQLAYGEKGRGKIPGKAELIFDVELLGVKDVTPPAVAADLVLVLDDLQSKALALAKAVPEEKYAWRPGPGVRSFKEVFLHIALGNELMLSIANGADKDEIAKTIAENAKAEGEALNRHQVAAKLTESFQTLHKAMETASAGALSRDVDFFGTPTNMRGVLAEIDAHIAEHLGQAIAYSRMNGVVPPWSK